MSLSWHSGGIKTTGMPFLLNDLCYTLEPHLIHASIAFNSRVDFANFTRGLNTE